MSELERLIGMNDTIAAISTASGVGAISIIRVSGIDAIKIVNSVFTGDLENAETHTINYGHIKEKNEIIDEVLVSVMKAPKTFTKEDIVEINAHGGIATTSKILELLLVKGCRLAEAGEFTKRAFLNGRIDLTEAEGIMDLINSKTENARKLALNEVSGRVSQLIHNLRDKIALLLANIEVNIDYPEYDDIEEVTIPKIEEELKIIKNEITKILKESENGRMIKEGIKTAIIGRPNVGKSSLLNKLLGENKAIVTDVKGTTRDIVEGSIRLDGIILNLIDTAGIRETDDLVESIGVNKSLELIEEAELILFLLANDEKLTEEDKEILNKIKNKNHIIIVNKSDLEGKLEKIEDAIYISALNDTNIDLVKEEIKKLFKLDKIELENPTYLTNARSLSILKRCLNDINEVESGIQNHEPIDMVELDLKDIWNALGEIIGETYDEELLDKLFSSFCVGK